MDTIKAIVQKVVPKGRHGPFSVATSDQVEGSVTFSLEPTVWEEKEWPEEGMMVFLGKLRKKRAGWRAKQGRFWKPSDEQLQQTERSKEMSKSLVAVLKELASVDLDKERRANKEFLADLDKVLRVLEAGPGELRLGRGRFVTCLLKVSAPIEGTVTVNAVLTMVPHDLRWASVQGVQIEVTAADGSKRLMRTDLTPGLTMNELPVGRVQITLGPNSRPDAW